SARAAGGHAEEIDYMLANARDSFLVVAGKESAELRIGGETADEVVGNCSEGVVPAQTLVKGLLLLGEGRCRRDVERRGRGEGCQGEIQERRKFLHFLLLKGG